MKRKTKFKLMAGVIVGAIFLSGCKKDTLELFQNAKANTTEDEVKFSSTTPGEIELSASDLETITDEEMPPIEIKIEASKETESVIDSKPTEETQIVDDESISKETVSPKESSEETINITEEEKQQSVEETTEIPEITEEMPVQHIITYEKGYTNDVVEMKASNSEVSPIITNLELNVEAIKIFTCDNGWDLIKCNEYIGYVKTENITYTEETFTPSPEYVIRKHNDIVVTTATLNFRTAPSQEAKRILTFNEETELQVIATVDNGWLAVKYNGQIGFVHGGYTISMLEIGQSLYPELQLEELKINKIVYANSDLNLRCGNSIEFESLGLLEKYESLRVLGEYDDWYFVLTNERNFGFVNKNYTTTIEDNCVVIDKSCQQLYYYEDNELLYTTEVTTGKDSTPSDTGLFSVKNKNMYVTLTDNETYWTDVVYWIRYNGGEGIHDANWRYMFNDPKATYSNTFGSESYHTRGSHGCINTPFEVVEKIYHEIDVKDKVLVHK